MSTKLSFSSFLPVEELSRIHAQLALQRTSGKYWLAANHAPDFRRMLSPLPICAASGRPAVMGSIVVDGIGGNCLLAQDYTAHVLWRLCIV